MGKIQQGWAPDGHLRSCLKIIGGKTGAVVDSARSRIYRVMPKHCVNYFEPFAGSGGILIGKYTHQREYLNDFNKWPIHFLTVLRDSDPEELWDAIVDQISNMDAEKFNEMRFNEPDTDTDPITAAAWYYAINKFARNGIVRFRKSDGKCNSTYCTVNTGRGLMTWDWMLRVRKRLQKVNLSSLDYREFLETYLDSNPEIDPERTIVCLDPPYSHVFTSYNGGDRFDDGDQKELAHMLGGADYYWLLTINKNDFIMDLYKWAHVYEHSVLWSCSNTNAGRGHREELIVTNYEIAW